VIKDRTRGVYLDLTDPKDMEILQQNLLMMSEAVRELASMLLLPKEATLFDIIPVVKKLVGKP